jgi:RNA polymerase sigma-70 factor, ECF subfamily
MGETLPQPLADAFFSALPRPKDAPLAADLAGLDAAIGAAWAAAKRRWSGVELDGEVYAAWLGSRAQEIHALSGLNTDDLYLACACARGDAAALASFEARYLATLKTRLRDNAADELRQVLRRLLFVAEPGAQPKIADYAGTGALQSWLKVLAVRQAVRLDPPRQLQGEDEELVNLPALGGNPELRFLKAGSRDAFKVAFHEALASLESRAQNVLRQHYIDGLSIDQLGLLHATHRTTAARWLREAREALMSGTKKALMRRAKLSPDECESVLRDVQSQLDLSIRTLLGD